MALMGVEGLLCGGQRFVECANVLLEGNADINNADRYQWTPLHTASANGHVDCVKVWWCDFFRVVDEKTISHFRCCAAPHRLECQPKCQNRP